MVQEVISSHLLWLELWIGVTVQPQRLPYPWWSPLLLICFLWPHIQVGALCSNPCSFVYQAVDDIWVTANGTGGSIQPYTPVWIVSRSYSAAKEAARGYILAISFSRFTVALTNWRLKVCVWSSKYQYLLLTFWLWSSYDWLKINIL